MPTFVLRNANLLDLEAGTLRDRTDVVVTDGKIADVGAGAEGRPPPTPPTTCAARR